MEGGFRSLCKFLDDSFRDYLQEMLINAPVIHYAKYICQLHHLPPSPLLKQDLLKALLNYYSKKQWIDIKLNPFSPPKENKILATVTNACSSQSQLQNSSLSLVATEASETEMSHTFPPEEFRRFRRKPVLLLLTGVSIALLNVCRAAAGLAKLGSVWRALFSFLEMGTRSFSAMKKKNIRRNKARNKLNHSKHP